MQLLRAWGCMLGTTHGRACRAYAGEGRRGEATAETSSAADGGAHPPPPANTQAYELPYLSDAGVSVSAIALAQTCGVFPMIIKGLLCVPSDMLHIRRPFVAGGLILSGTMFFFQSSFNPLARYGVYILCLMLRNTGAAISDGASDGLTIDADVDALSGTLSAWQGVGRMSGLIVSTLAGGAIAEQSFSALLVFLGVWMVLSAPVVALVREELTPSPLGVRATVACAWALNVLSCGLYARSVACAQQRAAAGE